MQIQIALGVPTTVHFELPLRHPEIFEKLGIEAPKGILLHGPPEAKNGFYHLQYFFYNEKTKKFHLKDEFCETLLPS